MNFILLLAGDHPGLALEEVLQLISAACKSYELYYYCNRLCRIKVNEQVSRDLVMSILSHSVLAKEISLELAHVKIGDIMCGTPLGLDDLDAISGKSFAVRAVKLPCSKVKLTTPQIERLVGGFLLKTLNQRAKVSLAKPDVIVRVYVLRDSVIIGLRLAELKRSRFRVRSPVKRPYFHPSALSPETASIMVNLSGIVRGVLLDPFCGTGSILIEASLKGMYCVGIDIKAEMVKGARLNVRHYNAEGLVDIIHADSCLLPIRDGSVDAIVTDPPYGRLSSTAGRDIDHIYARLVSESLRVLKRGGNCIYMHPEGTCPSSKLRLRYRHTIPVHSDLTRVLRVEVAEN